jgi:hypothetical protein
MNKDAFAAVTKTFDDDQKKAWKDLPGEKFDIKFENPFGGFGKDKKKKKKNDDDV